MTLPLPHCPACLALSPMAPPVLQCPHPQPVPGERVLPGRLLVGAVCWGLYGMESGGGSCGDRVCWVSPGPLWGYVGAVSPASGGPSGIEGMWAKSCPVSQG